MKISLDSDEPSDSDDLCSDDGVAGKMIENYDKHELISPSITVEPYEGMEFDSEESARAFYYTYASFAGFRVRVSRCQRSLHDGTIISRRFVCSREGFSTQKNPETPKRHRSITRIGCLAMLMLKKHSPDKWLVSKFIKDHNHDQLQTSVWKRMIAKPRKLEEIDIDVEEDEEEDEKESCAEEEGYRVPFPFGNLDLEPYEGMEFQTEEAARTFYYTYANDAGFTVRISKCRRARDGSIISRRFVCSKEGYYVRKYGRTKRSRALTRVGCLARLFVKRLDSGIWVVASFVKEHNHPPFADGEEFGHQLARHTNHGDGASLAASSCSLPNCMDTEMQNGESSMTWQFNMLHREGIRFAEEGAASVETFNVAMLALREATQKVNAAKNNAVMAPSTNNSASHRLNTNQGNSTTLLSQQCSNTGNNNTEVCCEGMLNHQANDSVRVPSARKLVNGQARNPQDNQERNIIVPGAVQKEQSPTENSFDENTSVSSGMQEGNQRKYRLADDEMENLITVQDYNEGNSKQDGVQTQTQGWSLIGMTQRGSNTGSGDSSTNVSLSVVQVEALPAVAEVFNVPTMGSMSSSDLPAGVVPVSKELLEGGSSWYQEAPKLSRNPLVHAAAIAAGARIAPPWVAASLIKAAQSRSAVHIRSGVPVLRRGVSTMPGAHQDSNAHYFQPPVNTGGSDQGQSPMNYSGMPRVSTGGSDQAHSPMDYSGMPHASTGGSDQRQSPMDYNGTGVSDQGQSPMDYNGMRSMVEQTPVVLDQDQRMMIYHCVGLAE